MKIARVVALLLCVAASAHAQIPADQRVADMRQLVSLYAKNYGPYEWKRTLQGTDLFDLAPWIARANEATTDLRFMDALIDFTSSLDDAHVNMFFPSIFVAQLPFTVDIYDGKVMIDSISRAALPVRDYPFTIGDELVSVDGRTSQDWIVALRKYAVAANVRSTSRNAAALITRRRQFIMPTAAEIGATASVVVRRANSAVETYTIPWQKTGVAFSAAGPIPSPKSDQPIESGLSRQSDDVVSENISALPFRIKDSFIVDDTLPRHMFPLLPLLNTTVPDERSAVLGVGARTPIFRMPAGFVQRLGTAPSDFFFSGIYASANLRIGFIRIPSFNPPSAAAALQAFEAEIAFFERNTDGLIVDITRNPGGLVSFVESLSQRLIRTEFRTIGFEIRATANWVAGFAQSLLIAEQTGAPEQVIQAQNAQVAAVMAAYSQSRGKTDPLSLNSTGSLTLQTATDRNGDSIAYSKPIMLLTDEFSASGGDMFAAIMQDNRRGPLFGFRTMGAGGSVVGFDATNYTEGFARVTASLMARPNPSPVPGFPLSPYIENVGVQPNIPFDYMTRQNLMNQGQTFVQAFTAAMVSHIRASRATPTVQ